MQAEAHEVGCGRKDACNPAVDESIHRAPVRRTGPRQRRPDIIHRKRPQRRVMTKPLDEAAHLDIRAGVLPQQLDIEVDE